MRKITTMKKKSCLKIWRWAHIYKIKLKTKLSGLFLMKKITDQLLMADH